MKKISVVVPVYFEELILNEFYKRVFDVLNSLKNAQVIDYELIFVNDGSTDRSGEILISLSKQNVRVRVIELSRNFGHQNAITAGIDHASGDCVLTMDGDLQDPPELIGKFISLWESGYQVVYGQRIKRDGESIFKLVTAKIFYRFLNSLSDLKIPVDVGDFRLMDRVVYENLRCLREQDRYIRGLVAWMGFNQVALLYERDSRYAGETKFSIKKMFHFAMDGLTSFSVKPLYFSIYFGFLISTLALLWGLAIVFSALMGNSSAVSGWPSIMVSVLFIGGIQLLSVGILGQYIARIFSGTKSRPLYLIKNAVGFENIK